MVKVFEQDVIFDYCPIQTIKHLHSKYPNPFATHVHSLDTLSRSVDPETGIVRSERLIGVAQGAPKWITKLFQLPPVAYVREVVFVDPSVPCAIAMSINLSLAQYVSCLELITYTPSWSSASILDASLEANPNTATVPKGNPIKLPVAIPVEVDDVGADAPSTLFHQRAILISGFPTQMIARRVEKASLDRFSSNAGVGRRGFEWVLAGGQKTLGPDGLIARR